MNCLGHGYLFIARTLTRTKTNTVLIKTIEKVPPEAQTVLELLMFEPLDWEVTSLCHHTQLWITFNQVEALPIASDHRLTCKNMLPTFSNSLLPDVTPNLHSISISWLTIRV